MVMQSSQNQDRRSATQASDLEQAAALRSLVTAHLKRQRHTQATFDLIDQIITRYPGCPRAQSYWVDRLLAGDEALADALREQEGI